MDDELIIGHSVYLTFFPIPAYKQQEVDNQRVLSQPEKVG